MAENAGPEGEASQQGPFRLTSEHQQALDRMLAEWERRNSDVTLFRCEIQRWEFDLVFNKENNGLKRTAVGELKYRAPDRGLYRVRDAKTGEWIEDWRCDGKAIYEFNYEKKQLIERTLPPELQGKAITNGPLPFIFSAKADTLKKRYFMRLKNPPPGHEDKICIEAYPRLQADAANFMRAELLLWKETMMPFALHLVLPNGKSSTDHVFKDIKTNDPLGVLLGDFDAPRTPPFWKRLIDPEGAPVDAESPPVTTVPTPRSPAPQAMRSGGAGPK
jgi:TIGR03009 family protein